MDKAIKDYLSDLGSKGGKARMAKLTKEEKRRLALKGVRARKRRRKANASL